MNSLDHLLLMAHITKALVSAASVSSLPGWKIHTSGSRVEDSPGQGPCLHMPLLHRTTEQAEIHSGHPSQMAHRDPKAKASRQSQLPQGLCLEHHGMPRMHRNRQQAFKILRTEVTEAYCIILAAQKVHLHFPLLGGYRDVLQVKIEAFFCFPMWPTEFSNRNVNSHATISQIFSYNRLHPK